MRHCDIFQRPVISQCTFFNKLEQITNLSEIVTFWHISVQGYPPGFTKWRLRCADVPILKGFAFTNCTFGSDRPTFSQMKVRSLLKKKGSFLHEKKLACGSIFVETLGVFFEKNSAHLESYYFYFEKKNNQSGQHFMIQSVPVRFERFKGRSAGSFCGDRLGRSDVRNCCLFGLHETGDATHSTSRHRWGCSTVVRSKIYGCFRK